MKNPIKLAYIGNGKSTNRYHIPFVKMLPELFQVDSIWAHSDSYRWDKIEGVHYTQDLEELLQNRDVELVIVTVPPEAHYDMVKKVLHAGKHCVCEKPFTLSYAQAEELFDLAEKKGLFLQCYQNRRFDSDFLTVQKVLQEGRLGEVYEVNMQFDYFRPEVPASVGVHERQNAFLYTHACHTLDQVISLWGEPDRVTYDIRTVSPSGKMNDYFDLDLFYSNLKVSVRSSYLRIKSRPSFIVYGSNGMFVKQEPDRQEFDLKHFYLPDHKDFGLDLPEHYGTLTYMDEEGTYHEEAFPTVRGGYEKYYQKLYETIRNGEPPLVTREQTLLQMRLLEEGIKDFEKEIR